LSGNRWIPEDGPDLSQDTWFTMKISRVQPHGPGQRYHRVCVPPEIAEQVGIEKGGVVAWQVLDDQTLVMKVVLL